MIYLITLMHVSYLMGGYIYKIGNMTTYKFWIVRKQLFHTEVSFTIHLLKKVYCTVQNKNNVYVQNKDTPPPKKTKKYIKKTHTTPPPPHTQNKKPQTPKIKQHHPSHNFNAPFTCIQKLLILLLCSQFLKNPVLKFRLLTG